MTLWSQHRRLRDRLTLWYVLVLGAVLAAYILGATLLFFWVLTSQMFHQEIQDLETVEGLSTSGPTVRFPCRRTTTATLSTSCCSNV